jgi:hypothetical protein
MIIGYSGGGVRYWYQLWHLLASKSYNLMSERPYSEETKFMSASLDTNAN